MVRTYLRCTKLQVTEPCFSWKTVLGSAKLKKKLQFDKQGVNGVLCLKYGPFYVQ